MADPFAIAQGAIRAVFVDREPIIYMQGGVQLPPIRAIRADHSAPSFEGPGSTLRTITYEIERGDVPARPTKKDTFTHRARKWSVQDVASIDDVDAWLLTVTDAGAA